MNQVITREDGTEYINISINIDPSVLELVDKQVDERMTNRSALIQSNLKAIHVDQIIKRLHQDTVETAHSMIKLGHDNKELYKELKAAHKSIKQLTLDKIKRHTKPFNTGRAANICMFITMSLCLLLTQCS